LKENPSTFMILGASLDTGNLGVSALLASTVQGILSNEPDVQIQLLEGVRNPVPQIVRVADGRTVELSRVGVRRNKALWRQNHIVRLMVSAMLSRLLPVGLRSRWLRKNLYLNAVVSAGAVMDITGGDSFSDIYGLKRLLFSCLEKFFILLTGTDLILLPQTYGPFKRRLSRILARAVLSRAAAIYSRDQEGLEQIRKLMGNHKMRATPQLCPDVAFILDAIRPDNTQVQQIDKFKAEGHKLIGLNISGLLYNGGYTRNNMFGLTCDYQALVKNIVSYFAKFQNHHVLLVPHVIPQNMPVENDFDACRAIWSMLSKDIQEKVLVLDGDYDQNQVKYLIGLCDFFMGARMHATIAALSQCVPAVGMAYSKKFAGVFQTAGVEDCVVDMWQLDVEQILNRIEELYRAKANIHRRLTETIPTVQQRVLEIFDDF